MATHHIIAFPLTATPNLHYRFFRFLRLKLIYKTRIRKLSRNVVFIKPAANINDMIFDNTKMRSRKLRHKNLSLSSN